jgi:hypothetical protein
MTGDEARGRSARPLGRRSEAARSLVAPVRWERRPRWCARRQHRPRANWRGRHHLSRSLTFVGWG